MRASNTLIWSLVVCLLLGACSARAPALSPATARDDPRSQPYAIGPSDVVRITVWKNPELSTEAVVRPDGTLTIPVVGELRAAGRTAADLQQEATQRVRTLVNDAVVTVSIVEVNSYRFTVAGNVEHPGLFTSRYYITISDAIALAGGPNRYATTSNVTVVRNGPSGPVRFRVDYEEILAGKAPEQDVVLHAGDAVRVP
jgi:polysaccharide export outer membrane protein